MLKYTPARTNELQLDLDTDSAKKIFKKQFRFLKTLGHVKVRSVRKYISRSGNQHVSILLSTHLPITERILLQAVLGSDLRRELCNWGRVKSNAPYPVLLIHSRLRSLV